MGYDNTRGRRQKSRVLPGFGSDASAEVPPPFPDRTPAQLARPEHPLQPAGKRKGRDTDIWHLAELFRDDARASGIELRKGLPIICQEINALVELWKMREKTFIQFVDACERRHLPDDQAAKCWFHTRTDVRQRQITWVEMVEVIMAEFWSRIWDEHALDYFRQYFAEFGRRAVMHWGSLSAIEAINARPKQPREVMRRQPTDATMRPVPEQRIIIGKSGTHWRV